MKPVDITNARQVSGLVKSFKPDEIYFLAAFHHSSEQKLKDEGDIFKKSFDVNVTALVHFLEGMRQHSPKAKLFYAASSHVFGNPSKGRQDESTPFHPVCIYGIAKAAGLHACRFFRDAYGLFASVGILYNHESPRRSSKFVSQKIVQTAIAIKKGKARHLVLGDLNAKTDWGYAPDYVEAMRRILQLSRPDDFVIASGRSHTVKDFVTIVFEQLGLDWEKYVRVNPALIHKKRKGSLEGNPRKLLSATGWKPKVSFDGMVGIMVEEGLKRHGRR
jgi:GDPmannose 4,6-dehydratase